MPYYAVANGRHIGVFLNWTDCSNSVKQFKNASYKKFNTRIDADNFIKLNKNKDNQINEIIPNNVISLSEINNTSFTPEYYVYTDGACLNNGKHNALAGIGIFFGKDDKRKYNKWNLHN